MAKISKVRWKSSLLKRRVAAYSLPLSHKKVPKGICAQKRCCKASEKRDWVDATCSVCMEFPHNAVLLLCSSYSKGCRPYMCATSCRYSNCLEQYKKAYTKVNSIENAQHHLMDGTSADLGLEQSDEKKEATELLCPLCRGQVKGWTVVDLAREYLNAKKRTCTHDNCSFVGNYKQLRKHVRVQHQTERARKVDPMLEAKWKRLESERERNDVISTIRSSMPGAIVLGDYVIEGNFRSLYRDSDDDSDDNMGNPFLESLESETSGRVYFRQSSHGGYHPFDEEENVGTYRVAGSGRRRRLLATSGRRRWDTYGGR